MTTLKMGPAVELPSGTPSSECEEKDWLKLVPARSFTSRSQQTGAGPGWVTVTHVSREAPGYAIYRHGKDNPEDLTTLLPRMDEPELNFHNQRIDSVLTEHKIGYVILGISTAVGVPAAIGAAAAYDDDSVGVLLGLAVAGLVGGLIADSFFLPDASELTYAQVRQYTLVPDEDDLEAAARGVNSLNRETSRRCGGY